MNQAPSALAREAWLTACAAQFKVRAAADDDFARQAALACAESQEHANGADVTGWDSPTDAADDDMSYWGDDDEGASA